MQDERLDYAYYRLSKEDGDVEEGTAEESCSIASQRTCVNRYLRVNLPEITEPQEIVDDGFSGTNMDRPGIQRLIRLVKTGKVRSIIVRDLSRFARNYLEAGHYLEFVFPVYDVRFISINDHFDSERLGESTGGLELAIRNLINEMYSKDISRKIKSVVDMKKLNGEYVYGTAPYGYRKGAQKNTIVPDEEAAQIVRQIFAWAASGTTITQIANRLNEEHVVTPSVYLAAVRGNYKTRKFWTFESVRNILANRIYTGDTEPFKSHVVRVGSNRVKQIPSEMRQVIPCTHEALISRELYFQAQETIKSNRKSRPSAPQNPLTSLLVCGCCGNRLSKGKAKNKDWLCASARYQRSLECGQIRVNDQKMQGIVLRAIVTQCRLLDAKIQKVSGSGGVGKSKKQLLEKEYRQCHRKLETLQAEKMQLYETYVTGNIGKDAYLEQKGSFADEEEELKVRLKLIEKELADLEEQERNLQTQISNVKQLLPFQEPEELTPELAKELIKRIVVAGDGSIRIEWNFYDDMARLLESDKFRRSEATV